MKLFLLTATNRKGEVVIEKVVIYYRKGYTSYKTPKTFIFCRNFTNTNSWYVHWKHKYHYNFTKWRQTLLWSKSDVLLHGRFSSTLWYTRKVHTNLQHQRIIIFLTIYFLTIIRFHKIFFQYLLSNLLQNIQIILNKCFLDITYYSICNMFYIKVFSPKIQLLWCVYRL